MWKLYMIDSHGQMSLRMVDDDFESVNRTAIEMIKNITPAAVQSFDQTASDPQFRTVMAPSDVKETWYTWILAKTDAPVVEQRQRELVEFYWPFEQGFSPEYKEKTALRRIFREAFMLDMPLRATTVRCRLDQFARFLILRNDNDCRNGFKNLKPKLVQVRGEILDVSEFV